MSINASTAYEDARSLYTAIKSRVAAQAKASGLPLKDVQRDFVFQRFLSRLFEEPGSPWVLKGGTGLRLRMPGARYSKDIDLVHRDVLTGAAAVDALRRATARRPAEQIWFEVRGPGRPSQINPVTTVEVQAYVGAARYLAFTIDLAHDLDVIAPVEQVRPEAAVAIPGLPHPPSIICYPLVDQVADKVCAMYETTASGPSSRYRDLVDLVLVLQFAQLDATALMQALGSETSRRGMSVPVPLRTPGRLWETGYRAEAARWRLPEPFTALDAALALVAECVEPLLLGTVTHGSWHPESGWISSP